MKKRHTVPVYDAGNKERLLGYLTERWPIRAAYHQVYVAPGRVRVADHPWDVNAIDMKVDVLTFDFGYRTTEDGWRRDGVVFTSDPLELLMKHTGFRLPGETEAQHHQRRYWSD